MVKSPSESTAARNIYGPKATQTQSPLLPTLVVWALWTILFIADLAFVNRYGVNIPCDDEWGLVEYTTGDTPLSLQDLWSQHNEHRIFLPKLLLIQLTRLARGDLRANMFFTVSLLGFAAALMIFTARRIRGHTTLGDSFFPLGLLHWGHAENLTWSFQVGFSLPIALLAIVLHVLLAPGPLTWQRSIVSTLFLLAVGLCGAAGLPYLLLAAIWFVYFGAFDGWRRNRPVDAAISASCALLLLVFLAAYCTGYQSPHHHPLPSDWKQVVSSLLKVQSLTVGLAAKSYWPLTSSFQTCLLLAALILAIAAGFQNPNDRCAISVLLIFLLGASGTAAGIAWGRSALGPEVVFSPRYVTLMVPLGWAIYLLADQVPNWKSLRALQLALVFTVVFLTPENFSCGLEIARRRHDRLEANHSHLLEGGSVLRWAASVKDGCNLPQMAYWANMLRKAGVGRFKNLRPDNLSPQTSIDMMKASTNDPYGVVLYHESSGKVTTFETADEFQSIRPLNDCALNIDSAGHLTVDSTGDDPSLSLPLPTNRHDHGLLVRIEMTSSADSFCEIFFKEEGDAGYSAEKSVRAIVKAGPNVVLLRLTGQKIEGPLRLDPVAVKLDVTIDSISIREVGN
jgi:hypothetical protein